MARAVNAFHIEVADGDSGGITIDNYGTTVYGAGDNGYVFRVVDEDTYASSTFDGATIFEVLQDSGVAIRRGVLTLPLNNQVQWADSGGAMIYGTSSKRIIIDGSVGIGATSPAYNLDVAGTLRATGAVSLSSTLSVAGDITVNRTINAYKNTPNGTAYHQLGIQVYSSDGSPVGIGFHRGGYSQTILEHNGGDGLAIRSSGTIGTGAYGNLTANAVTASNYYLGNNNQIKTNAGYLELVSAGNEMCIGGVNGTMHVNYRAALGDTPTTWYWRAGTSTSYANFNVGSLTANGILSSTNRIFTGYDSGQGNSMSCSN